MSVSTRTRFEVFKRDGFTCRYCGRKAPDVQLHVDHIEAVANGGTDEMFNLVAACQDCNLGKSDKPLSDVRPDPDIASETSRLQEIREYREQKDGWDRYVAEGAAEVREYWRGCWTDRPRKSPFPNAVKGWLQFTNAAEIIEAIDIAFERCRNEDGTCDSERVVKYLAGIMRNKRAGTAAPKPAAPSLTVPEDVSALAQLTLEVSEESRYGTCVWGNAGFYELDLRPKVQRLAETHGYDRDALMRFISANLWCECSECESYLEEVA